MIHLLMDASEFDQRLKIVMSIKNQNEFCQYNSEFTKVWTQVTTQRNASIKVKFGFGSVTKLTLILLWNIRGSAISPLKCPYWNCGKMFSTHSELMSYKINDHASDTRYCYYRPTVEVLILVVYKPKMLQIGLSSRHPEVHQKRSS